MIKFSVIMAVYNSAPYLRQALDSILNQSLKEIEVICVNDGSPDNSAEILSEYEKKDPRVTVITQKNQGASSARNAGLRIARGKYIQIVDGDDMMSKGAYDRIWNVAQSNKLDMLLFDANTHFDGKEIQSSWNQISSYYVRNKAYDCIDTGREIFRQLSEDKMYRSQASMYVISRKLVKRIKLRFLDGYTHEDNTYTFMAIMEARRAMHINEKLFIRRMHSDSTMTSKVKAKNVIGLFQNFSAMYEYSRIQNFSTAVRRAVIHELSLVAASAMWKYTLITPEEREAVDDLTFETATFMKAFAFKLWEKTAKK